MLERTTVCYGQNLHNVSRWVNALFGITESITRFCCMLLNIYCVGLHLCSFVAFASFDFKDYCSACVRKRGLISYVFFFTIKKIIILERNGPISVLKVLKYLVEYYDCLFTLFLDNSMNLEAFL